MFAAVCGGIVCLGLLVASVARPREGKPAPDPVQERLRGLGFHNVYEVNFGLTHTPSR